ncbi:MAG TPA: hypothetical protein PKH03_02780 [Syntrophales bacterium]|nr:hypothetical protein [Syntrophales bacterium]
MRKRTETWAVPAAVLILYATLIGVFLYILDYAAPPRIEAALVKAMPWVLRANMLLLVAGALWCWPDVAALCREIFGSRPSPKSRRPNARAWALALLVVAAAALVIFAAPQVHRIYYDEDIYANVGQNIALTHQAAMCNYGTFEYGEYFPHWLLMNKEPTGWPFLMSLVFQGLGVDERYAFGLNNVLYLGGILLAFFIAYRLARGGARAPSPSPYERAPQPVLPGADGRPCGNGLETPFFAGFVAALAYAVIPHNLLWSNTAAVEPSAAFFTGLVVLLLVVYLQTGRARHLFVLAGAIPLACQMRAESALILFWIVAAALLLRPVPAANAWERRLGVFARREVWIAGLLCGVLLLPHALHLFVMKGQSWGAEGAKFAGAFFRPNLAVNSLYYLANAKFPAIFTLLALAGIACGSAPWRARLATFLWFLPFWGIFLFFYAGSYGYGADVRFALVSFMPLAVLAGLGAGGILGGVCRLFPKALDSRLCLTQEGPAGGGNGGGAVERGGAGGAGTEADGRRWFGRTGIAALLVLVVLFCWLPFLPLIRTVGQEAWGARHDHLYAQRFARMIPERSIVLTHIPTMFLLWGQGAVQAGAGLNNPDVIAFLMKKYAGHVYFHENYWCSVPGANQEMCRAILAKYDVREVAAFTEQNHRYALYQIKPRGVAPRSSGISAP